MGIELTRGNSTRCPPFLAAGAILLCLFLLCNWWTLSSENFELLRQNDNLADQLKFSGEELWKCKDLQNRFAKQEVQIRQIKDSDQELQQLQLQCQKQKEMCQTEMESMKQVGESQKTYSESLKSEKITVEKYLNEEKAKTHKLQKELEEKNEKIRDLEKVVEEKKRRINELERSVTPMKGNNFHSIGMNQPLAKILNKMAKKNDNLESNPKTETNDQAPGQRPENLEPIGLKEENNGGEAKNEDADAEAGDPREQEMFAPGNNVENT